MTPEAKAREIVEWFGEQVSLDTARDLYGKKPLAACIAEALRQVRLDALREAENLIIEFAIDDASRRNLRKAIRSLMKTEDETQ